MQLAWCLVSKYSGVNPAKLNPAWSGPSECDDAAVFANVSVNYVIAPRYTTSDVLRACSRQPRQVHACMPPSVTAALQ